MYVSNVFLCAVHDSLCVVRVSPQSEPSWNTNLSLAWTIGTPHPSPIHIPDNLLCHQSVTITNNNITHTRKKIECLYEASFTYYNCFLAHLTACCHLLRTFAHLIWLYGYFCSKTLPTWCCDLTGCECVHSQKNIGIQTCRFVHKAIGKNQFHEMLPSGRNLWNLHYCRSGV